MELKIYNQQGVFKTAVSPSDSDRHVKEVMNDNILNLSFTLYEYVELGVNDYVLRVNASRCWRITSRSRNPPLSMPTAASSTV